VKGIDEFTHIWVVFKFHHSKGQGWKEVVRPPRLGGKEGRGVFATRSPFRPNDIGLSVVKLLAHYEEGSQVVLEIEGGDFLDSTPVYDIKPYLPYADSVEEATSSWAQSESARLEVIYEVDELIQDLNPRAQVLFHEQARFIEESLSLDPRPAYERGKDAKAGQIWGVLLGDFEVKFTATHGAIVITKLEYEPAQ